MSSQEVEPLKWNGNNDIYDEPNPVFSQDSYFMSDSEKERKITQFRKYLDSIDSKVNENDDSIALDIPTNNKKHFLYFIGRLNPPHDGHIEALKTLIRKAHTFNSTPLILLGSGPKKERTLDNPIPFDVKKRFIEKKLAEDSIAPGTYIIQEMDNPSKDVSHYISSDGGDINYDEITVTLVAGDKGDDASKLNFTLAAAEKAAKNKWPTSNINIETQAVAPITSTAATTEQTLPAMSATEVRKSVYSNRLNNQTFDQWDERYKSFYGDMAKEIYNAILEPASTLLLSRELLPEDIQDYINTSQLPKKGKRKAIESAPSESVTKRRTQNALPRAGNKKTFTRKNKQQLKHNKTKYRNKKRTFRKRK
jgi:hypothetical protein